MNSYATGLLTALTLVQAAALLWLVRRTRVGGVMNRVEERLTGLTEAITLLTETSEAGFKASAAEISRLGGQVELAAKFRSGAVRGVAVKASNNLPGRVSSAHDGRHDTRSRPAPSSRNAVKNGGRTLASKRGRKKEEACQAAPTSR